MSLMFDETALVAVSTVCRSAEHHEHLANRKILLETGAAHHHSTQSLDSGR